MIDSNNADLRPRNLLGDRHSRATERAVSRVNRDGVILAVGITAHVADNAQPSTLLGQFIESSERRQLLCEINTVDEDIRRSDFIERSALRSLLHIPLQNRVDAHISAELHGSAAAAPAGADDDNPGLLAIVGDHGTLKSLLNVGDQGGSRIEDGDGALRCAGVEHLVGPGEKGDGCASVASPVAEGSDSALVLVGEEFQIVEAAAAVGVAGEGVGPAVLLLEAVLEVDVFVGEGGWGGKKK